MKLQILLCILCLVPVGQACFGSSSGSGSSGTKPSGDNGGGGGKEPGAGDIGGGNGGPAPEEKEPLDKMGIKPEDTNAYDAVPCNPDAGSDNKNFDCNDAANCQWGNAAEPEDQLDWRTASKPPHPGQWQKNFASTTPPDGAYFVTAGKASPPEHSANLVACSINCAQGDVLVGFGHWSTENVKFEACKQAGPGAPLEACAPVAEREGPSIVQVAGGSNFNIVIRAMNFVDAAVGDVAVIDNLLLDYVPCGSGGSTTPGTNTSPGGTTPDDADKANCEAINCSFETEGSLCGGTDAADLIIGPDSPYHGHVTKYGQFTSSTGNPVTGIQGPPDDGGATYLAAELDEQYRYAAIQFPHTPTTAQRQLVFDYYEATEGMQGFVCFDKVPEGCTFATKDEGTQVADRAWKTSVPVDIVPDSKLIYVVVQNKAVGEPPVYNSGVFGLDNIRYLNPNAPPEAGSQLPGSACPPSAQASLASRKRALRSALSRRFSRHIFNV